LSLKAFHITFIAASVLAALGFAAWAAWQRFAVGNGAYTVLGLVALVVGVGLIFYGLAFARKIKALQPPR
jgi:hypothetical protein